MRGLVLLRLWSSGVLSFAALTLASTAVSWVALSVGTSFEAHASYRKHNLEVIDAIVFHLKPEANETRAVKAARESILKEVEFFQNDKNLLKKKDILKHVFSRHNPSCMTLAQMAAHYQAFDLLQYLMRRGANVNLTCSANPEKGCASPFVTSIIRGDIKAFNLMMDRHPDLTARFESGKELLYPTQIAIRNRNEEIALKLWETRKEFLTARDARFAVRNEMERIAVEYYRVNPADLTEEVFFDAAYAGADSVLVFALKEAEPQARFKSYLDSHSPNHGGKTAAMIAAERGHSNALSILLGAGAIVQTRDAKGRTLVHSALKSKDPQVLQIVLEVAKNNSNLRAEKLSDRRVYRLLKAGILAGQTDNFVSILKFLDRINLNTLNRKDELIEHMIQKGQDKLLKKFISLGDVKLNLDKIKMMNIESPAVKAVIQEYIAL